MPVKSSPGAAVLISSARPEMRLLVTRPAPDAERTARRLSALGHDAIVEPLLRLELPPPADVADPAAIAVTSRNGVRALAAWPRARGWHALPHFAVGAATAEAARAAGFADVRSAGGDGAALAETIIAEFDTTTGHVLYPTTEPRSPVLEHRLRDAGIVVDAVIAYRMVAADRLSETAAEVIRSGGVDGVLLYSKRSAAVFLGLAAKARLTAALRRLAVFVLSSSVAEQFGEVAVGHMTVAAEPNEDAMMQAVGTATGFEAP